MKLKRRFRSESSIQSGKECITCEMEWDVMEPLRIRILRENDFTLKKKKEKKHKIILGIENTCKAKNMYIYLFHSNSLFIYFFGLPRWAQW